MLFIDLVVYKIVVLSIVDNDKHPIDHVVTVRVGGKGGFCNTYVQIFFFMQSNFQIILLPSQTFNFSKFFACGSHLSFHWISILNIFRLRRPFLKHFILQFILFPSMPTGSHTRLFKYHNGTWIALYYFLLKQDNYLRKSLRIGTAHYSDSSIFWQFDVT